MQWNDLWWILPLLMLGLPLAAAFFAAFSILYLPKPLVVRMAWGCSRLFYRIRLHSPDQVPAQGGALLVGNHISWLDGILMLIASRRHVRMIVYAGNFQAKLMQRAAHRWGAILIAPGPKSIVRALQEARAAIQNGDVVGLFPEGGISRSGVMQTFKPGLMRIIDGVDAPVIPMYLDGLWGASSAFTSTSSSGKSPSVGAIRLISTLGNPYTRSAKCIRFARPCNRWEEKQCRNV